MNIKKFVKEWVLPILAAVFIAILINKFVFFNVKIPSGSMIPTLNIEDKLIVARVHNTEKLQRGDIVVFNSDELNEIVIKRLIGLPGDHVEVFNGTVTVNGETLEEDYVKNNEYIQADLVFDVPEGKYFFLGDNRANSYDARKWKNPYIDEKDIMGKAIFKYYPFSDIGKIE